jgi:hypothetical protein
MECPFCAEQIKDEASVCKHCSRDLRIPKPLIEENLELTEKLEQLQKEVDRLRAELARRSSPLKYWSAFLGTYALAPILILIAAHYLLIVYFNLNPLVLRIVSMVVPLPFGFALNWAARLDVWTAVWTGVLVGAVAVAGMTTAIGLVDNVSLLPENFQEWRETIEYAASIALAFITGNILALVTRNTLPKTVSANARPNPLAMRIAVNLGPNVGSQALRRRAERIHGMMVRAGSLGGAAGTAVGTVYTGVRSLIGS